MAKKYCYLFSEGNAKMRELLGGKGANLAEMTKIGLPVPQGFTISTEACTQYYEDGRQINPEIQAEIMEYISKMEEICGKKFGDQENPLLVSVRSGARASMPGMMDTILNLGLNEDVVNVIAKKSGNPRWAWDCYRRFIQMFSDVVMEVGKKYFEKLIDEMKEKKARVEDALHATRAAVEEGISAGGSVALLRTAKAIEALQLKDEEAVGARIVRQAIEAPLRQLCENAGVEGALVVSEVLSHEGAYGYNVATGTYEDLLKAGVVDPTKVTRTALQNAASVSGLLLTTECMIAEVQEDKPAAPAPDMGGMGGMGGMM